MRAVDKLQTLIRYGTGVIGLRKNDVILAGFEKSGSTWVRFIFCNIVSICEMGSKTVDWKIMDSTMPELGASNLLVPWAHPSIPRVVKTHKAFWPVFAGKRSILLIRNPMDVMVSYYHYLRFSKVNPFNGPLSDFIRQPGVGLEEWFRHYLSWQGRYSILLTYEALRQDAMKEFSRLLDSLDIHVDPEVMQLAVERSSFEALRSIEKEFGVSNAERMKEGFVFIRRGRSGAWKEEFEDKDVDYYNSLKKKFNLDLY
jgi:estrone sulfotransferase